jgi:hypothetical protein
MASGSRPIRQQTDPAADRSGSRPIRQRTDRHDQHKLAGNTVLVLLM